MEVKRVVLRKLLTVICALSFSIICIKCNENKPRSGYLLFATVDSSAMIKDDAKVILNGKQIGALKEIILFGGTKVLNLKIGDNVKIPSNSDIKYFENILGDSYIAFTYSETSPGKINFLPNDTVQITAVKNLKKLDTTQTKAVIKEINDVLKVVDSSMKN